MYTRSPQTLYAFGSDERGTVAMIFGVMLTGLLFFAGMALDYSRAMNVRSRVSDAADAAALAAGRALMAGGMNAAEIRALALKYFNENVKSVNGQATVGVPQINVDPQTGGVTIDVNSKVKLTLARIIGKQTLDFPISTAVNFSQKDIEVGMALDITGSMGNRDSNGQKKIDGLKQAFESFATRLIPDNASDAQKVRIGVAPYAAGLNLGDFADDFSANRSKDGCVTERKDGKADDDVTTFAVAQDGAKDTDPTEGNVGNSAYGCPSAKLIPLSDDRETLIKEVKKFKADGWTAGHIGTQWAWNLISDQWNWGSGSIGESYDLVSQNKLMKAVVLMTDGTFNTAYNGKKSSDQAIALCGAMKAKGVVVFAVAFDATPAAEATLKACASNGTGYYANASTGDQLEAAFNNFAAKLTELRVSK